MTSRALIWVVVVSLLGSLMLFGLISFRSVAALAFVGLLYWISSVDRNWRAEQKANQALDDVEPSARNGESENE